MKKDTIRIAVRKFAPFEAAMEKLWKAYCAHSGCTLEAEMIALDVQPLYETTLGSGGLAGGEWDIAHLNTDWIYEAYSESAVEDLAPYISRSAPEGYPDGWTSSLLQMQQFDKKIVGLPFHDGPECLIYRKDLFDDPAEQQLFFQLHGRPLSLPQTWEEFEEIARFFNRPDAGLYGCVFACYPDDHNTVFDFCLQLWTRGGELSSGDGRIGINTPEAAEGLDFYRRIIKNKDAVHPGTAGYDSVEAGMAFARGEVAMMVNWFGFASMCEVYPQSAVKGKTDVSLIPGKAGKETASLNVYWLYTIGSGSSYKQTAYDFISFALRRENDKLLTLEGGIGCRISTWNDEEVNRIIPYYHKLEELHRYARSMPLKSNWAAIASIINEAMLNAMNTTLPTAVILQEAQNKIDSINQ